MTPEVEVASGVNWSFLSAAIMAVVTIIIAPLATWALSRIFDHEKRLTAVESSREGELRAALAELKLDLVETIRGEIKKALSTDGDSRGA